MANAIFTRDEVILALDVLYFSNEKHLNSKSFPIKQLSSTLQKLPIYPLEYRNVCFRNESGVAKQINGFQRSILIGEKNPNIGKMFFTVAYEYEENKNRLHRIAESIQKNLPYFDHSKDYLSKDSIFPEGILLEYLHYKIEKREGKKVPKSNRCAICQLQPEALYQPCGSLLQKHLLIDPIEMNGKRKYDNKDFVTVCPNCHSALHQYRPWLSSSDFKNILY